MTIPDNITNNKLPHYRAWIEAWRIADPSPLPAEECLSVIQKDGPQWLRERDVSTAASYSRMKEVVACFKAAAKARVVLLGGSVPPTCDETDVLSETYDARVDCSCSGFIPSSSSSTTDAANLRSCECKAIQRMVSEGELVNSKKEEWNTSTFFSSEGLLTSVKELALCHGDIQPPPSTCQQGKRTWPEVKVPGRKPNPDLDLDEKTYSSLFPTTERIRLSADAKHFFALASGGGLNDPGIQMAIADSGNDILIGDYCDAATEEALKALQKDGAAAFWFLKLCVYAGTMSDWHFAQLVAQTITFRIISYWRDHTLSHDRRPQGVYGSRMTAVSAHRHIDLGMVVGIVSASLATGQSMNSAEYSDLVDAVVLINDLIDFRGDTWRNQRENIILRGTRGNLCTYLDDLSSKCIGRSAALVRRGKIFALMVMCFCSWMLMSSGHKFYETMHGTRLISQPCHYKSEDEELYQDLLAALERYGTLGEKGPSASMKRKELQILYVKYRESPEDHIKWNADVVRVVLHPGNLRRLVDVVHYEWTGDLGAVDYCP